MITAKRQTTLNTISIFLMGSCFAAHSCIAAPHVITSALGVFNVSLTDIHETKFKTTIRQERDFSCGSAALATLLSYHYQFPISEHDIFSVMYQNGDQQKIRREGFSLLDMKRYLESEDFRADGFIISLDELAKIGVPAIALINDDGYRHFVVIKGIERRYVLLGDPAKGIRMVERSQFEKTWNGITFVIRNKYQLASANFNHESEWGMVALAPMDTTIPREGISNLLISLPGLYEY